ncbi:adenylate/guanylate cyclase domain-containing protein [Dongia sedimenti]|uniref:Adenylate/guanylate cyclase domain-containing protein n=1 Tax=Dongia sedimenti TaxID=3064282 RepID=A0ABU0YQ61_9PROT|nr:adenylate/guanylate cyclase domain-containing protein [Rhodospirillaceae bacterium R-7]
MDTQAERRLTNILSADVVGYSRLLGLDEAGTLATLRAYRGIMDDLIRQHRGRVVNSAGDGILAEFQSAVLAVQCAVEIQRQIAARNQALEADRRMWFRIGINLGDVIVEHDDLFGEDVNIAARLQALAEPGGILISGAVFDQVKHKLSLGFEPLGPQHLKNIDAEVPAYRAVLQAVGEKPAIPAAPPVAPSPDERWRSLKVSAIRTGALIVLLILINLFSWQGDVWFQWPVLGVLFLFVLNATRIYRR